ncbi:MAG: Lrp/AsnC family transcriptional regulator [Alphaproteobacteria bacterium]|nr:Lrp/AsnC family transcriptional regulator [Alphaproteobacteria bacterium]
MPRSLDAIDLKILTALQADADLSNKELAARVGLAPSSALARVRRLRADGALGAAHAEVDPRALGVGLQALIAVQLDVHHAKSVAALRDHLLGLPEVVALFHTGGEADFLVHVAVRDAEHLRQLAFDAFAGRAELRRMETNLIFEVQRKAGWPCYADGR